MPESKDDNSLADRTLQKIGLRLIAFQRFEKLLKIVAGAPNYSGSLKEVQAQHASARESLSKESLGLTAKRFFDRVYLEYPDELTEEEGQSDYLFQSRVTGGDRQRLKAAIQELIDLRNDFIHHKLVGFDRESIASLRELEAYLDRQGTEIRPLFERVRGYAEIMIELRKAVLDAAEEDLG